MIEDNKISTLINCIGIYLGYVICRASKTQVNPAMIANKTLDKKFI